MKYKYFILLGLIVGLLIFIFNDNDSNEADVALEKQDIESTVVVEETKVKVDIKGAVNNPGVYELDKNSRVSDVINLSGGLTEEADTSVINLSKNVSDEMVIIIYTKDEIKKMQEGETSIKYIEKECICPKLENDACIEEVNDEEEKIVENNQSNKISLNNATISQLMELNGIGQTKAEAIIEYRQNNGGFKTIEEIMKVDGIGQTTYDKIKDQLTL